MGGIFMFRPSAGVLKIHVVCLALGMMLARDASAQSASQTSATAGSVGTWRGTSVCLVHPSACHDESVVYRITQLDAPDSVAIDARKIVNGEEQGMGVLGCRVLAQSGQVICVMPQGVWHFRVSNDSLTGELRLPDNTRYRDVRAVRAP
jgi:hypothetical protein